MSSARAATPASPSPAAAPAPRARRAPLILGALLALASAIPTSGASCNPTGSPGGGSSGAPAPAYTPRIASIGPPGRAAGEVVTIAGQDFETTASLNSVLLGTAPASVLSSTSTEVVCRLPASLAAGTYAVKVSTRAGASAAVSYAVAAAGAGAPEVTGLTLLAAHEGDAVAVLGRAFATGSGGSVVTVGGVAASVRAASSTRLDVTVPAGARTGPVVVRTAAGASNGFTLFVTGTAPTSPYAPGIQGPDFLSDASYDALLVEVDHVAGEAPSQAAIDPLLARLVERCRKPRGVRVIVDDPFPSPGLGFWFRNDLFAAEQARRDHQALGGTLALYVLYVDAGSQFDQGSRVTAGYAYHSHAVAVFRDNVEAKARSSGASIAAIERPVLAHEAGHTLGLVNIAAPMARAHHDASHPTHCRNACCLMYFETSASAPTQFDADCVADLRAAGGR